MYDFMEYCLRCFYRSTGWNEENQYSNLCSWSRALLDFYTPHGLSLYLAKLPTPQFKPAYTMNALPSLNGSIGYLYTHQPLNIGTSATVDFKDLIDRFRVVHTAPSPDTGSDNHCMLRCCSFFRFDRSRQQLSAVWSPFLSRCPTGGHVCTTVNAPSPISGHRREPPSVACLAAGGNAAPIRRWQMVL